MYDFFYFNLLRGPGSTELSYLGFLIRELLPCEKVSYNIGFCLKSSIEKINGVPVSKCQCLLSSFYDSNEAVKYMFQVDINLETLYDTDLERVVCDGELNVMVDVFSDCSSISSRSHVARCNIGLQCKLLGH